MTDTQTTARVTAEELGYLHGWDDGRRIWNGADGRLYHPGRRQPESEFSLQEREAYQEAYNDGIDDSGAGSFLNGEVLESWEEEAFNDATPTRDVYEINSRIMAGVTVERVFGRRVFRTPTEWQATYIAAAVDGVVSADPHTGEHFVEAD